MKSAVILAGLVALLTPIIAADAAPKAKAAAKQDWLNTTNRTPDGAVIVGNPAAKVKLVEYLSLTCPHCAVMSAQIMAPLKRDYIVKGLVSYEVRHAVRDGYDFVGSLLVRCQPGTDYLGSLEALFATQQTWEAKGAEAKNDAAFAGKSPDEQMDLVAHFAGFDSFFAKRGMTPKRYAACMADKAAKQQLGEMADKAWNGDKIEGTPSFKVNGQMLGTLGSWADLESKIKAAL